MGEEALHELIEQINESDVDAVYFVLSRIVGKRSFAGMTFEEVEPEPDEIEIIKEYEKAKTRGEKLLSHEEVWGEKPKTKEA